MDAWHDVELAALKDELRERARAISQREADLDAWERQLEEREAALQRRRPPRDVSLVEQLQVRARRLARRNGRGG